MKSIATHVICLCCLVLSLPCLDAAGETMQIWERPPRVSQVGPGSCGVLTAANAEIVTDAKASKLVQFAATELQTFLSKILKARVPIVHQVTEGRVSLILGVNSWSRAAGIDDSKLVRDGFVIRTQGQRVYIVGRDDPRMDLRDATWRGLAFERATLFGVYEFLERVCGVRFYFPGELGTVVPERKEVTIPVMDIFERPDFTQRRVFLGPNAYFEGGDVAMSRVLNECRMRTETETIPCCHGINGFKLNQRFQATNPEYFALLANGTRSQDGHLCWSSQVVEELYQDAKSFLKGNPPSTRKIPGGYDWHFNMSRKYVDLMAQDGFQPCHCPQCQAAYVKGDSDYATNLVWGRTAEIARRLKEEGIPGYVTQMSYTPYQKIPALPISDNVLVMVARTGPWMTNNPSKMAEDNAGIRDWAKKLGHKVWIWNYPSKVFSLKMPGIPQMAPNAYANYYKSVAPWIFGVFAESETDRFLYNYLNHYVFAKVCWNTQVDHQQLLAEHYQLMFGQAAKTMRECFELMEKIWIGQIVGRTVNTDLGPMAVPPSDYDLWHQIYTRERMATIRGLFQKAAEAVPKKSLEARRIDLMRREFLEPLQAHRKQYEQQTTAVRGLKMHVGKQPKDTVYLQPFTRDNEKPKGELVQTAVQVWRTDTDLGIRFRCEEPDMEQIAVAVRKSDDPNVWQDNSVEVFLNPTADRRTYYQLIVNSNGNFSDQKLVKFGSKGQGDFSWNSDARITVERQAKSWTVQVTVPLSKFPGIKERFPVNFTRSRILKQGGNYHRLYVWSPFARDFHDLENFGSITSEPDRNILVNSDFTMGKVDARHWGITGAKGVWLGGWIADPDYKGCRLDKDVYVSAPSSMRIDCDGKTRFREHVQNYSPILPPLKLNTRYRLSFYVKLENVRFAGTSTFGRVGAFCTVWCQGHPSFPPHNFLTGTMDWTYMSFDFKTGSKKGASECVMLLGLRNVAGTAWFDDVRLEEL